MEPERILFIEEVIYRGFLLPQVFLLLVARKSWDSSKALLVALLSSQAYFALNHLPAALLTYREEWLGATLYIIQVLLVGILFAAIYIRTGNLFVAIGLHALINFPSELFVSRLDPFLLVLMACCAILIAWPYLNRSLEDVFTLRPSFIQPQQSGSENVKVLR